jgi:hypothetical protein
MVIGSPLAKLPLLARDDHLHKIIYTLLRDQRQPHLVLDSIAL